MGVHEIELNKYGHRLWHYSLRSTALEPSDTTTQTGTVKHQHAIHLSCCPGDARYPRVRHARLVARTRHIHIHTHTDNTQHTHTRTHARNATQRTHTHTHTHGRRDKQGTGQSSLNVLGLVRCSVKTKSCSSVQAQH